jgi:uncharacterized oligopeptide transporter (OPT) family protein
MTNITHLKLFIFKVSLVFTAGFILFYPLGIFNPLACFIGTVIGASIREVYDYIKERLEHRKEVNKKDIIE